MGSTGVIVDEQKLDTFIVPDPDEVLSDTYAIKAFFPADVPIEPLLETVQARVLNVVAALQNAAIHLAWRQIGNQDWAEGWKQYFNAVRIGKKLVIRPSWEQIQFPNAAIVTLDPGMAFGTGTHGTTRLCLEFIAELHDSGYAARHILDVGTGSGILAIAGVVLGAEHVIACDIDPVAVQTAQDNAELNGCADRIEVTLELLQDIAGTFDLVVANILAEENVRLVTELCARVASGGYLVLSGILHEKVDYVTAAFSPCFATPAVIDYAGEWACIKYRRTT